MGELKQLLFLCAEPWGQRVHWLGTQVSLATMPFLSGPESALGVIASAVKGKKSRKLLSVPVAILFKDKLSPKDISLSPYLRQISPTDNKGIWEKGWHGSHLASLSPLTLAPLRSASCYLALISPTGLLMFCLR